MGGDTEKDYSGGQPVSDTLGVVKSLQISLEEYNVVVDFFVIKKIPYDFIIGFPALEARQAARRALLEHGTKT